MQIPMGFKRVSGYLWCGWWLVVVGCDGSKGEWLQAWRFPAQTDVMVGRVARRTDFIPLVLVDSLEK